MDLAVRAWKSAQGCCDCGERDPDALDCDHDGDDKVDNIANLTGAKLLIELRKVVVRCVPCHRRITALRSAMAEYELTELDEYRATLGGV